MKDVRASTQQKNKEIFEQKRRKSDREIIQGNVVEVLDYEDNRKKEIFEELQ